MKTKLTAVLALGFFFASNSSIAAGKSHDALSFQAAPITVSVFDYAKDKPRVLAEAEQAASAILFKAGVEVTWISCSANDSSPSNPACMATTDPMHLALRILPERMSKRLRSIHDDALGFALLGVPLTSDAWILYDRTKDLAQKQMVGFERLLGAVIAHELGHLLLAENVHASAGLMHGSWSRAELLDIELARLFFSDSEHKRIQSAVALRYQAASAISAYLPSDPISRPN